MLSGLDTLGHESALSGPGDGWDGEYLVKQPQKMLNARGNEIPSVKLDKRMLCKSKDCVTVIMNVIGAVDCLGTTFSTRLTQALYNGLTSKIRFSLVGSLFQLSHPAPNYRSGVCGHWSTACMKCQLQGPQGSEPVHQQPVQQNRRVITCVSHASHNCQLLLAGG